MRLLGPIALLSILAVASGCTSDAPSSDTTSPNEFGARWTRFDGLPGYDTQLIIDVRLPNRSLTIADVFDHVYGKHLDDGSKPWPYYRDTETAGWWSLSTKTDDPLDALVWMIPLDQLKYKTRKEAEAFLHQVYGELAEAAREFGGKAVPECNVTEALRKMDRVEKLLAIRDYRMELLVRAPKGRKYSVNEWWIACEASGLQYGDGDLFWLMNSREKAGRSEPLEQFSVEPYSEKGYFHPGDRQSSVAFPDVVLSFYVRDFADPENVLIKMAAIGERLAEILGAEMVTVDGEAFDFSLAKEKLRRARAKLESLEQAR